MCIYLFTKVLRRKKALYSLQGYCCFSYICHHESLQLVPKLCSVTEIPQHTEAVCSIATVAQHTEAVCSIPTVTQHTEAICSIATVTQHTEAACSITAVTQYREAGFFSETALT